MNQPLSSPHTALRRQTLATKCLCCARPLWDAESATLGVGPICRKRLGIADSLKAHSDANELVARAAIAAEDGQFTVVMECLQALNALDPRYQGLVDRTHARLFKTRVARVAQGYLVVSTYNSDTNSQFKCLGMRWDPVHRGWRAFSTSQLEDALKVLANALPSNEVLGPDGEVVFLIKRDYLV
jgi:Family of unknown function (DUF6011)